MENNAKKQKLIRSIILRAGQPSQADCKKKASKVKDHNNACIINTLPASEPVIVLLKRANKVKDS